MHYHFSAFIFMMSLSFGAPELNMPDNAEVPFVGDNIVYSKSEHSDHSLILLNDEDAQFLTLKHNSNILDSIKLPKNAEIHSPIWTDASLHFLVRIKTINGSRAAAIGYFDLSISDMRFILYDVIVGENKNGIVFDVLDVKDGGVRVVCRFKNGHGKRDSFIEGLLKRADLKMIPHDEFIMRFSDGKINIDTKPLERVED